MRAAIVALALLASLSAGPASAGPAPLVATTLREYPAPEADQGVAVDDLHFYAVDNRTIARYRRSDGQRVAMLDLPEEGPLFHLNSCRIHAGQLWCAHSNYPALPMGSSIERFDPKTLKPAGSHSLGLMDEGSLVWLEPVASGWLAAFAHYDRADGLGGTGFKNSLYGSIILLDDQFRRNGGWLYPPAVQERLSPHSASGGAIGPDGLLYVMGHDRAEIYVLAQPLMGPYLVHLATIAVEAAGQAFSFVPGSRDVMVVDRKRKLVRQLRLPEVPIPQGLPAGNPMAHQPFTVPPAARR